MIKVDVQLKKTRLHIEGNTIDEVIVKLKSWENYLIKASKDD